MSSKKSFILYNDQRGIFEKLSDEQAGKLIKHIFSHVNNEEVATDFITELAFEPIKQSLIRDNQKYENICERNRDNGKKGGRPKKPKKPSGLSGNPKEPKKADSDSDSVSDSESETKDNSDKSLVTNFLEWYRSTYLELTKKQSKVRTLTKTDINNLKALKKDYSKEDFKCAMIMMLKNDWAKESGNTNPAHLLRNDNFVRYLTQYENKKEQPKQVYNGRG